jgi:hypothetical protein
MAAEEAETGEDAGKKVITQEFAGQVKSINAERIKPPKPEPPKPSKDSNARQKALEYSKNVPKPAPRRNPLENSEDDRPNSCQEQKNMEEQPLT